MEVASLGAVRHAAKALDLRVVQRADEMLLD